MSAQVRWLIGELPNVRLILYDNRGHGRTAVIGNPKMLNFLEMADNMAALLNGLCIPAAVVGGVSMGRESLWRSVGDIGIERGR
jgi:pimeloyl-ACP methyl ester carboxylesterase